MPDIYHFDDRKDKVKVRHIKVSIDFWSLVPINLCFSDHERVIVPYLKSPDKKMHINIEEYFKKGHEGM